MGGDGTPARKAARNLRADRLEERLAVPVIVAALVSVPAVFLTTAEANQLAIAGHVLNWASLVVLTAESAVLFLLTGERLAWVWRHRWPLAILAISIPAVIVAAAPMQTLRLVVWLIRMFGALRILRANRIVRAGRVLARRIGWTGPWRYLPILGGSLLAAGFVALVLVDPTAMREHQRLLAQANGWGLVPVLIAGAILAVATVVVVRYRRGGGSAAADGGGELVGDRPGQLGGRGLHHHPDE